MTMSFSDTIAAVSTPRGKGGVAVIRISGGDAAAVAGRVFSPRCGKNLDEIPARRAVHGDIFTVEPDGGRIRIDDGLAVVFRAPYSFTGEDTVEINCHGGVLVTRTVLEAVLCAGARHAEAGEFTRRAFLAGKITLAGAEALGTLLEAKTHEQLLLSRSGMDGALSAGVGELYGEMRGILANLYAVVDFPDEDLSSLSRGQIEEGVAEINRRIGELAATYRTGRAIAEGIHTVICGRTNSGKSSLYNRLTGTDAAIVTDIAGTTRDVLESTVSFGGVTLRLMDTAGLRESGDTVEMIGVGRARREAEGAELVLAVTDGSRPADREDSVFAEYISTLSAPVIWVVNKADLPPAEDAPVVFAPSLAGKIKISALNGEGMDSLAALVRSLFIDGGLDITRDAITVNARQYAALRRAGELTGLSLAALAAGYPEDICCSDLERAMGALAEIDGREVSADIVSEIFSRFCVGK